jgi:hypothetical protein
MPAITSQSETKWLLQQCLNDLTESVEQSAPYDSVLAICETTSSLVKKFEAMNLSNEGPPRSGKNDSTEIPHETVVLLGSIVAGKMRHCAACGGWRDITE